MPKFSNQIVNPSTPITTTQTRTSTFESAPAWNLDIKSELFLLAVTNMVSESTFYEDAKTRDTRFTNLIHAVTQADPSWMQSFIPWLRKSANMRSAPIVALAEYVKAGGPNARPLIAATLSRADEPAELLAYWHIKYGRKLPASLKRGIADACTNLYNEFTALRYDGQSRGYRMGDVIELTHPKPSGPWQSQLFRYLVGRTHNDDLTVGDIPELNKILTRHKLENTPQEERRTILPTLEDIESWEWLSGWLPGGMDAEAWEAVIPHMGYMALLRNLRNFDQAGISSQSESYVLSVLTDPQRVASSRQFPYRFYSAYKNAPSLNWGKALEKALELSTRNLPDLPGRTLVVADTSGSMQGTVSNRSSIAHYEIAAVIAGCVARMCEAVDFFSFASTHSRIPFNPSQSILRTVESVHKTIGRDGMGTVLGPPLQEYDGHDRVIIVSDMQVMSGESLAMSDPWGYGTYSGRVLGESQKTLRSLIPSKVPVHAFNTGGYGNSAMQLGKTHNTFMTGGFSDAAFRMLPLLERRDTSWPWE